MSLLEEKNRQQKEGSSGAPNSNFQDVTEEIMNLQEDERATTPPGPPAGVTFADDFDNIDDPGEAKGGYFDNSIARLSFPNRSASNTVGTHDWDAIFVGLDGHAPATDDKRA